MTWVKRESRYGGSPVVTGPAAANDGPTNDILTSLNARRKRIWRKSDWPWSYEKLVFSVVPGNNIYSVAAVSGKQIDRIQNIIPNDPTASPPVAGKSLKQRTYRQFFDEIADYDPTYPGLPVKYLNLGQVNGVWQVQIWPGPTVPFKMGGSAKGVLNTFLIGDVTGVAPFSAGNTTGAANPPLDYFPDGVIEDILFEGVMGDVGMIQGDKAGYETAEASFEAKLKLLAAEEANAAKDNTPITSPLPAVVRRRRAGGSRRGY